MNAVCTYCKGPATNDPCLVSGILSWERDLQCWIHRGYVQLCRYECIREIDIGNTCYLEMFPYRNILSMYHSMCIHRMLLFASTNHHQQLLWVPKPIRRKWIPATSLGCYVKHSKTFKILSNRLIPSTINHVISYPITLYDTIVSYFRNKMISHEHNIYNIYVYIHTIPCKTVLKGSLCSKSRFPANILLTLPN